MSHSIDPIIRFSTFRRYNSRIGVLPPLGDEPTLRDVAQMTTDFDIPEDTAVQLKVLRKLAKIMQAL